MPLIAILFGALLGGPLRAAIITVDIGFQSTGGTCRLENAIIAANTDAEVEESACTPGSDKDTILIDLPANITQIRTNVTLDITSDLEIVAADNRVIRNALIDGDRLDQSVFTVTGTEAEPLADVSFMGIEIIGGNNFNTADSGGGAVDIEHATVSMDTVLLQQNIGLKGGAIRARNSDFSIKNCRFATNNANQEGFPFGQGGAINAEDSIVQIDNCVFFGNVSNWRGGAINGINSDITVENSTFETNIAVFNIVNLIEGSGEGGAIYLRENSSFSAVNTTFSNNQTLITVGDQDRGNGGAISSRNSSVELQDVSMIGNQANNAGGGVYMFVEDGQAAELEITASLIADNRASVEGGGREISFTSASTNGVSSSGGSNIIGVSSRTTAASIVGFTPGQTDLTATSDGSQPTLAASLFSALNDNGSQRLTPFGNSETHTLPEGSPAIDGAAKETCLDKDQLGNSRNQNACDVGAFESPFGEQDTGFFIIVPPNKMPVVVPL